jgi:hypothetical protein
MLQKADTNSYSYERVLRTVAKNTKKYFEILYVV